MHKILKKDQKGEQITAKSLKLKTSKETKTSKTYPKQKTP